MNTDFHPSYGPVPKAEFLKAANAPYGGAAAILRKFSPSFGIKDGRKEFKVTVTREMRRTDEAEITVVAACKEDAEKIVQSMNEDDFEWKEGWDEQSESIDIDQVKEVQA